MDQLINGSPESYQQLKIFQMLRQNFGGYPKE
jgi:hypothetical protein